MESKAASLAADAGTWPVARTLCLFSFATHLPIPTRRHAYQRGEVFFVSFYLRRPCGPPPYLFPLKDAPLPSSRVPILSSEASGGIFIPFSIIYNEKEQHLLEQVW